MSDNKGSENQTVTGLKGRGFIIMTLMSVPYYGLFFFYWCRKRLLNVMKCCTELMCNLNFFTAAVVCSTLLALGHKNARGT